MKNLAFSASVPNFKICWIYLTRAHQYAKVYLIFKSYLEFVILCITLTSNAPGGLISFEHGLALRSHILVIGIKKGFFQIY